MAKFWIRQSSQYPGMAQHSKYARICLQRVLNISHTIYSLRSLLKVNVYPANIRLDEDVLKTSFIFVFRRRLQDVLIKTNMFALALRLQKTSSRRLQDVLVKTNIFVLAIRLQDVFKTFSRRLQDIFKTSCKNVFKTSSRRLAKISSRRFQDVSSS